MLCFLSSEAAASRYSNGRFLSNSRLFSQRLCWLVLTVTLTACGSGGSSPGGGSSAGEGFSVDAGDGQVSDGGNSGSEQDAGGSNTGGAMDETGMFPAPRCASAASGSSDFAACEQTNFAITTQAPAEQSSPEFQSRIKQQDITNGTSFFLERGSDPLWQTDGNLCETWMEQCAGDPFFYPSVDPFYTNEAKLTAINFYDRDGARLSGRVWAPIDAEPGDQLPAVIIENGSVQAPEPLYWWFARSLVRAGYVVMTFDPRGQGRSDNRTPDGTQGSNANPIVFVTNLVDAIDWFYSTPAAEYAHNSDSSPGPVADNNMAETTNSNPFWQLFDRHRLGVAGHSLGATGVSVVQGLQPWPGNCCSDNPIQVVVAWDNLTGSERDFGDGNVFAVTPRVPAMGQSSDYGLTPMPFNDYPNPDGKSGGFFAWRDADISTMQLIIKGGTHYEWSLIPTFPASAWDPGGDGGWGNELAREYSLAWMDRWLKLPGEDGFDDADARLLNDAAFRERLSYYYRSSRDYTTRNDEQAKCDDILTGCPAPQ